MSSPGFARYQLVASAFAIAGFAALMVGHWWPGIVLTSIGLTWNVAAAARHPSVTAAEPPS